MSTNPTGGTGGIPDPRRNCSSEQCITALAAVAFARNAIIAKCNELAMAKSGRDVLAAIGAVFATLAVGVAAAAAAASGTVFGIPVALVLLVVAATLAATALAFFLLAGIAELRVLALEHDIANATRDFETAVTSVTSSCDPSCWGDLKAPSCT